MARDYATISPSARWLLLAKAHSGLPYAREAAELVFGADALAAAATPATPIEAARRRHFELRARSVDEALDLVGAPRIVELAAGLAFRGLARAARVAHYLDTDLPAMVELKRGLVERIAPEPPRTYRLESLDALDAPAFAAAIASLPAGPLAIAHEGFLMYLDAAEKARLATSIRTALVARGGAWITADIYIRMHVPVQRGPEVEKFLADHKVEEQKFGGWDEAEAWFRDQGFVVERRLAPAADAALVRQTWILAARP